MNEIMQIEERTEERCKGLFFRLKENMYINKKGEVVISTRLVPLKRCSCPGCSSCGYLKDDLQITLTDRYAPEIRGGVSDGAMYELIVTDISRDYETGIVDAWSIVFQRVQN